MKDYEAYRLYPKDKATMLSTVREIFDDYDDGDLNDAVLIRLVDHYSNMSSEPDTLVSIGQRDVITGFELDEASRVRLGKSRAKRFEMISNRI